MNRLSTHARAVLLVFLAGASCLAQDRRAITFDDLISFGRVEDPQISPDGKWVAYSVTRYDIDKNAGNSDIWLVSLEGGVPRRLTHSEGRDNNPRWSADGRRIAFVSSRDGDAQIWTIDVANGRERKLTSLSGGADGLIWSRNGRYLAFTSQVYPDCRDAACNKKRKDEAESSAVKAKIIDRLLFRHWSSWKDGKRSHVFVLSSDGGVPRDLTPGDFDAPPFSLGGPTDYDLSPDGTELCFARNTDGLEALSTNADLWVVSTAGGEPRKIASNPAYDGSPLYSPDGKHIAYRAQKRPGFESDRFELMVYDRVGGSSASLTSNMDRSVGTMAWAPDGKTILFTAEDEGYSSIFSIAVGGGMPVRLTEKTYNSSVQFSPNGRTLVYTRQGISRPAEIFRSGADGRIISQLTHVNDSRLSKIEFGAVDAVRYQGADGADVQAWIVKPPKFEPGKKWPAIVLIHGGPQSAWNDVFHYRWNLQMFASRGYVVFAPNPRGSTGFGQHFTDEISGDWGGKVYTDIIKGVDYLGGLPYVDGSRIAAAGGSFGGYMVNWLAGHTERLRSLVSHCGVFNTLSMFGSTEELWFPAWEFMGYPWTNPDLYAKWSPSNFVKNFKTPMLVIHGERDYRVPVAESLQLFTALQLMEVPSKFLYFPDEGHWILKPQNSRLWYKTVLDWFDQWMQ